MDSPKWRYGGAGDLRSPKITTPETRVGGAGPNPSPGTHIGFSRGSAAPLPGPDHRCGVRGSRGSSRHGSVLLAPPFTGATSSSTITQTLVGPRGPQVPFQTSRAGRLPSSEIEFMLGLRAMSGRRIRGAGGPPRPARATIGRRARGRRSSPLGHCVPRARPRVRNRAF